MQSDLSRPRHVVDSQSFPLSIPNSPQLAALAQNGAYAPMLIYTPEDIQMVVNYAGVRGIDVVMVGIAPRDTYSRTRSWYIDTHAMDRRLTLQVTLILSHYPIRTSWPVTKEHLGPHTRVSWSDNWSLLTRKLGK